MGADLSVVMLTNADPRFYPLIGPFLARREIERETGARIWDDSGKTWFAAVTGGELAGFCATVPSGTRARLCSDYVVPAFRGRQVYGTLFAARMAWLAGRPASAACTAASLSVFLAAGFRAVRKHGRYTEVARDGN